MTERLAALDWTAIGRDVAQMLDETERDLGYAADAEGIGNLIYEAVRAQGVRVGVPSIRETAAKYGIPLTEHDIPPDIGGVPPFAADYEGVRVGDDGLRAAAQALVDYLAEDAVIDGEHGIRVISRSSELVIVLRAALAAQPAIPKEPQTSPELGVRVGDDGLRAALEEHTPWARAIFAEQRIWLACSCGWNAMNGESGTWNEHALAAQPAPTRAAFDDIVGGGLRTLDDALNRGDGSYRP